VSGAKLKGLGRRSKRIDFFFFLGFHVREKVSKWRWDLKGMRVSNSNGNNSNRSGLVGWRWGSEKRNTSKQGGNWVGKKANIDSDILPFLPNTLSHTRQPRTPLPYSHLSFLQIKTLIPSSYSVSHHLHTHIYTHFLLDSLFSSYSSYRHNIACNGASTWSCSLNPSISISTTWPQFSCLWPYLPFPSK